MARAPKATPKATRPIAPATVEAMAERFKDFPAIEILTRRFNDPADPGTLPILLKDEAPRACVNSDHQSELRPGATTCHQCGRPARKWYLRWVNTEQEDRWSKIKSKGYIPVEVAELADAQEVPDLAEGKDEGRTVYVRRGDRGQQRLVKMPLEWYVRIKARERELRTGRMQSAKARHEERAEIAGKALGDEAGQSIYDGAIKEEFFRSERTTLGQEVSE